MTFLPVAVRRLPWHTLNKTVTAFFTLITVLAVIGVGHMVHTGLSWVTVATLGVTILLYALAGSGVTSLYHRCLSHGTFRICSRVLKCLWLVFAAATIQLSAYIWESRHIAHHDYPDDPLKDPYGTKRWGVLYAHFASLFSVYQDDFSNVEHLKRDRLVMLQHKYYWPLAFGMAFGLPMLICSLWGDAWGGFLCGGALRLVVQYNFAFSVNSLAHSSGDHDPQMSEKTETSATNLRNAFLKFVLGLGTLGEALNHRVHHAYPGIALTGSHFDITGWTLQVLERWKLIEGLRTLPADAMTRRHVADM